VRTLPHIDAGSGGSTSGNPRFLLNGGTQPISMSTRTAAYRRSGLQSVGLRGSYASRRSTLSSRQRRRSAFANRVRPDLRRPADPAGGAYPRLRRGADGRSLMLFDDRTCATIAPSHATRPHSTVTARTRRLLGQRFEPSLSARRVLANARRHPATIHRHLHQYGALYVALDGGLSGARPTQRKLTQAAQTITYGLYLDATGRRLGRFRESIRAAGTGTRAGADPDRLRAACRHQTTPAARHLFGTPS